MWLFFLQVDVIHLPFILRPLESNPLSLKAIFCRTSETDSFNFTIQHRSILNWFKLLFIHLQNTLSQRKGMKKGRKKEREKKEGARKRDRETIAFKNQKLHATTVSNQLVFLGNLCKLLSGQRLNNQSHNRMLGRSLVSTDKLVRCNKILWLGQYIPKQYFLILTLATSLRPVTT